MEGVENNADRRMTGAGDNLPRITVIRDVPTPGERFKADPQTPLRRTLPQLAKVIRGTVEAAECGGRHVGANQQKVCAKQTHQVEFPLRAFESPRTIGLRQAFEIAKRLQDRKPQPRRCNHPTDLRWGSRVGEKVALENLYSVKSGSGDG